MIIRIWRGLTEPQNANAFLEYVETSLLPRFEQLDGFQGADVLTRNYKSWVEFLIQTRWVSMEAIAAFTGEDSRAAMVRPGAEALLVDWDRTVRHYLCHSFRP